MAAELDGQGKILRITNNPLRPDSEILLCARGAAAHEEALSPDRLTRPLKRMGERGEGRFFPISWEEALGEISGKLSSFRDQYGAEKMMLLAGSGSCRAKVHSPSPLARRFFAHWGKINDTRGYYSDTAASFAEQSVFGGFPAGQDAETFAGSELVILWGANIRDLRFGAKLEGVLKRLKKEGVPFYVIDPRRTGTVRFYTDDDDHWLAVRPGSDSALMAAVLHCWLEEGLTDESFLSRYTTGFEELRDWVLGRDDGLPKTPAWAAEICGISERQIRDFSIAYGKASPAALIPGLAIQRTLGGEEAYRMGMALQAAGGNAGRRGGSSGVNPWGPLSGPAAPSPAKFLDAPEKRFGACTVPINRWQDHFLEKDLIGIYAVGSNYALQSSDQRKTLEAFKRSELTVCHDLFLTGTALWADYVLPVTHFLERNDLSGCAENYLYYSRKVLDPPGNARNDLQIFSDLADLSGFGPSFHNGLDAQQWLDRSIDASAVEDREEFLRIGIYDGKEHHRLPLEAFIDDPEGHPMPTPSGCIHLLCPQNLKHGFPAHPHFRSESLSRPGRLQLITPHSRLRTNSQHAALPRVAEQEPACLHIHPDDAALRKIDDGDLVCIENERGKSCLPAVLDRDLRPGVVWGYQGNWKLEESLNRLSSTESTMPSSGSRTHTIDVEVSRSVSDE